jgi:hypothetical protein
LEYKEQILLWGRAEKPVLNKNISKIMVLPFIFE